MEHRHKGVSFKKGNGPITGNFETAKLISSIHCHTCIQPICCNSDNIFAVKSPQNALKASMRKLLHHT